MAQAKNRRRRKRYSFAQQSVLAYILEGERYADAKIRLDRAWAMGKHPTQNGQ